MKTQNVLLGIMTVLLAVILVFVILIWRCTCKDNCYSNEITVLNNEMFLIKNSVDSLKSEMNLLKKENSELRTEVDSLTIRVSQLEECCGKKQKTVKKLESQIRDTRKQINEKRDSLNGIVMIPFIQGPACYPNMDTTFTTDSVKEEVDVKNVTLQVVKTSFDVKGNSEQQITVLNYSAPISFSSLNGFAKDSLNYNYSFVNEKMDSSMFSFNSLISGNTLSLSVNQNKKNMFSENKVFPLGAGGLQAYEKGSIIDLDWTSQRFLERTFDPQMFKRGNREIILGSILIPGGIVGTCYYSLHPIVDVKVYKGDQLVGRDKTYNIPMIVVSAAAIPIGTYLLAKGINNRKLSFSLTPTEFSLKCNINSK